MENLTGRRLGPYEITAPIGEGGMAAVYQAYEARQDRYLALKVLPRHRAESRQFLARFQQEAQVIARLKHPNILPVHDAGEAEGYTYIAMPLVTGGTLARLLRGRPLPPRQTLRVLSQVGAALDYAHAMGFVHRDVKPSNVMFDTDGNCLLMDFGLAKVLTGTDQLTRSGSTLGTPAYMSPEQGRGDKVDGRSDLYALGVMLYEMATGRVPFEADTPLGVIVRHIQEPLPPPRQLNPAIPEPVERVIARALAKQPDHRYQSAAEMVEALRAGLAAGRPAPERPGDHPRPRAADRPQLVGERARPQAPPQREPQRPVPPAPRAPRSPAAPRRPAAPGTPVAPLAPPRSAAGGLPLWVILVGVGVLLLLLCVLSMIVVSWGRLVGF